jgi:glycosyltransferase involved in cell wall biosynthesis
MKITVAICTWNRARSLLNTLEGLTDLDTQDAEWEVIVVNNNSSDNTEEVINDFYNKLPLVGIIEEKAGLSNARNAAIDNASGDYIIWTDDDVLVEPQWLSEYVDAFSRFPDVAYFGGPIIPKFSGDPPAWLRMSWKNFATAFAAKDLGRNELELVGKPGTFPFGANYAIKSVIQNKFRYNPDLGRKGNGTLIGGEEVSVMSALSEAGYMGRWVPMAIVHHVIERDRQSRKYISNYFEGIGSLLDVNESWNDTEKLLGYPRWALRRWVEYELEYWLSRLTRPPEIWTMNLVRSARLRGALKAFRRGDLSRL